MAKSKDQLFAKIDNLLIDINTQYTALKNEEKLDGVEVTLLVGSVDYLSKHIESLKYLVQQETSIVAEPKESCNKEFFTPPTVFNAPTDKQEVFEEIVEQSILTENKEIVTEEPISVVEETIVDQSVVAEEVSSVQEVVTAVVEEEKVVEIIENIVSEEKLEEPSKPLSINELIQQQKKAGLNLTQQFQTNTSAEKQVVDLKTAVSLNDKLLFIKDLFNGYSLAYSEAIELLNRFQTLAEADAFLQTNYALKNSWSEKPLTVEKFYTLLGRKFTN